MPCNHNEHIERHDVEMWAVFDAYSDGPPIRLFSTKDEALEFARRRKGDTAILPAQVCVVVRNCVDEDDAVDATHIPREW